MKWLKLFSEARNDAKLRTLSSDEFRTWFNLLCLCAEQDTRGVIAMPHDLLAVEVCGADADLLSATLKKLVTLRIVTVAENGDVTFINFAERQARKPSDAPEATRERKRKQREQGGTSGMSRGVTRDSRASHATEEEVEEELETDYSKKTKTPSAPAAASSGEGSSHSEIFRAPEGGEMVLPGGEQPSPAATPHSAATPPQTVPQVPVQRAARSPAPLRPAAPPQPPTSQRAEQQRGLAPPSQPPPDQPRPGQPRPGQPSKGPLFDALCTVCECNYYQLRDGRRGDFEATIRFLTGRQVSPEYLLQTWLPKWQTFWRYLEGHGRPPTPREVAEVYDQVLNQPARPNGRGATGAAKGGNRQDGPTDTNTDRLRETAELFGWGNG